MADKGFDIQDLLVPSGMKLNIPPFRKKGEQFSGKDVEKTQKISKVRIHVERLIDRFKDFQIFRRVVPLTLFPCINQAWAACCLLTLFQTPIISKSRSEPVTSEGSSPLQGPDPPLAIAGAPKSPEMSSPLPKCFFCSRSDGPSLRECTECHALYHLFCQLDEDGHYCNLCFSHMSVDG